MTPMNRTLESEVVKYSQIIDEFTTLMNMVTTLSNDTHGRVTASWREEYGSYVFTKLVFHAIALRKIVPDLSPENEIIIWDIASIAVLARALIETYYVFYYIAVDDISEEEAKLRYNVWEYHSVTSRLDKLKRIKSRAPEIEQFKAQQQTYRHKLMNDSQFTALTEKKRKNILDGNEAILLSNQELSKRAGIDPNHYKAQHKSLSSYVHTFPYCVSQLAGFSSINADTVNLFTMNMSFCTGYLAHAVRDFIKLCPDQLCHMTPEVDKLIDTWTYIFSNIGTIRDNPDVV